MLVPEQVMKPFCNPVLGTRFEHCQLGSQNASEEFGHHGIAHQGGIQWCGNHFARKRYNYSRLTASRNASNPTSLMCTAFENAHQPKGRFSDLNFRYQAGKLGG
jgi:hypothetical protein